MRILIGTGLNAGAAEYQNIGDIAMLQVAVSRLAELWPDAEIFVLTDSIAGLARFCPLAQPASRYGAETWINDRILLGGLHRKLPGTVSPRLSSMKRSLASQSPALVESMLSTRFRLRDSTGRLPSLQSFLKVLRSCDLLVICGAGGFADSCGEWNLYTLGLIEAALAIGTRVALFGQGLGPLTDPDVLSRMRQVLPGVILFSSRGTHGAAALAKRIGIPDQVFMTTGDEAVEPAYDSRPPMLGGSLGINLRIAPYSGVSECQSDAIGEVLREFSARRNIDRVPLPIAIHSYADDRKSISRVLKDSTAPDGMSDLDSPQRLYAETAKCRVVVTGAYHAAVFALAQGIPAVCIAASEYYAAKFEGLQASFGEGCAILKLQENDSMLRLALQVETAWERAASIASSLCQAACSQIAASREAYLRVRSLFPQKSEDRTSTRQLGRSLNFRVH